MTGKTWEQLQSEGWERRISGKTNRVSYKRPVEGGRRKIVSQRRDLTEEENKLFGEILWPGKKRAHIGVIGGDLEEPAGSSYRRVEPVIQTEQRGAVKIENTEIYELGNIKEETEEYERENSGGETEDYELENSGEESDEDEREVQTEDYEQENSDDESEVHEMESSDQGDEDMAAVLKKIHGSNEFDYLNIDQSVSELDDAMRDPSNPLRQKLPLDQDSDFFVDVLKFAINHNKCFIYTILKHTMTNERIFDDSVVILMAKIYIIIASAKKEKRNRKTDCSEGSNTDTAEEEIIGNDHSYSETSEEKKKEAEHNKHARRETCAVAKTRNHRPIKDTTCEACGIQYESRKRLQLHREKEHPEPYTCHICGEVINRRRNWQRHKLKHKEHKFNCPKCDYHTWRNDELKHHMMLKHPLVNY